MIDFIANLYELFGSMYVSPYSETLYERGSYMYLMLISIGIPLVILFAFYAIDKPVIARRWVYFTVSLISLFIVLILTYMLLTYVLKEHSTAQDIEIVKIQLVLVQLVLTLIFIVGLTIFGRKISTNNKHNPF